MLYTIWLIDICIALLPFFAMGIFYYTILWLPDKRNQLAQFELIALLKPTDTIETKCGIVGKICARENDVFIIQSANSTLAIKASAIAKKI